MILRPPRSTRTDTLFPSPMRFRSFDRLDQRDQRIEPRPLASEPRLGQFGQPHPRTRKILCAPQDQRLGGVDVALRAPGFLLIALYALRQASMGDEADVGLGSRERREGNELVSTCVYRGCACQYNNNM